MKQTKKVALVAAAVVILICVAVLLTISIEERIITGSSHIEPGDSFDFNSGKVLNNTVGGDIHFTGNSNPPPYGTGSIMRGGAAEYYLHVINAIGLYDAGKDFPIDCRIVNYSKDVIGLSADPGEYGRTICIKTEEGWIAKGVFYNTERPYPKIFNWTLYKPELFEIGT